MSDYPWNEKNDTFTWLSTLYNPFKQRISKFLLFFFTWIINLARSRISYNTPPFIYHVTEAVFQRCSVKNVFKQFAKFTGKHLCQGLFFNKGAGLRPAETLKVRSPNFQRYVW